MVEIIPAILTDSSGKFKELVRKLEPYASRIHIDIADGEFVPNKTVAGYNELREIESAVKFDIHLMVKRPQDQLKKWFYSHADRFIIHIESEINPEEIIGSIKEHGRKVGLAMNPETNIEKVEKYLNDIDFIQFMTVHPGFQGGDFVESVLGKVQEFNKKFPNVPIAVDGSMHVETA